MKKIGIMGSHGTGKTTLAFRLANEIKGNSPSLNVAILPEVARVCPLPINEQATMNSQRWIYHKQMTTEIEMADHDILICDRTILDSLAYSMHQGYYGFVSDYLYSAVSWLSTYDKLYFLRPTHAIQDDGVRSTDAVFQLDVDRILASWIDEHCINVSDIVRDSRGLYENNG